MILLVTIIILQGHELRGPRGITVAAVEAPFEITLNVLARSRAIKSIPRAPGEEFFYVPAVGPDGRGDESLQDAKVLFKLFKDIVLVSRHQVY